jgi:hypothetical protein
MTNIVLLVPTFGLKEFRADYVDSSLHPVMQALGQV